MRGENEGIYVPIDADGLVYLVAYKFRDSDNTDLALQELDNFVRTLLDNTSASYYAGFIGGEKCFRYDIAKTKPYKGNRPPSPDWYKKWCGPMKAFLRDEWNFQIVNSIEADDAVCIYQTWCRENNKNSIMCHGDKDLYQIEGNHYDIRKHTRKYVSEEESFKTLYRQVLTGDTSDNILGCKGIGKVKAAKILPNEMVLHTTISTTIYEFQRIYGNELGSQMYVEMHQLCKLLTHSETLKIVWNQYTPKVSTEEPEIDLTGLFW